MWVWVWVWVYMYIRTCLFVLCILVLFVYAFLLCLACVFVFYVVCFVWALPAFCTTRSCTPTHTLPLLTSPLWCTERLLAAQNPLSQADRPHQIFADAPPSHPVPPPENRPTQKAPERTLQPHTLPNMQPIMRAPPPLFSESLMHTGVCLTQ